MVVGGGGRIWGWWDWRSEGEESKVGEAGETGAAERYGSRGRKGGATRGSTEEARRGWSWNAVSAKVRVVVQQLLQERGPAGFGFGSGSGDEPVADLGAREAQESCRGQKVAEVCHLWSAGGKVSGDGQIRDGESATGPAWLGHLGKPGTFRGDQTRLAPLGTASGCLGVRVQLFSAWRARSSQTGRGLDRIRR
jgi:hypothetical protein